MFGLDWDGNGSVDLLDDLLTLSVLGALEEETEDDEVDDDEEM